MREHASQSATERLDVTALVSLLAQHCVVADERLRHHETPYVFDNCKDNIISDKNNLTVVCYVFN